MQDETNSGPRSERRKHQRVGSKYGSSPLLRAKYLPLSSANRDKQEGDVLDLSMGGLALKTGRVLEEGDKVEIILPKPGSEEKMDELGIELGYRLLAEVRWKKRLEPDENVRGDTAGSQYIHGLMFLPRSMMEARNRRGIEAMLKRFGGDSI